MRERNETCKGRGKSPRRRRLERTSRRKSQTQPLLRLTREGKSNTRLGKYSECLRELPNPKVHDSVISSGGMHQSDGGDTLRTQKKGESPGAAIGGSHTERNGNGAGAWGAARLALNLGGEGHGYLKKATVRFSRGGIKSRHSHGQGVNGTYGRWRAKEGVRGKRDSQGGRKKRYRGYPFSPLGNNVSRG